MADHPNCAAVKEFLAQIPSLSASVVPTKNVSGKPVSNGYMAAWSDSAKKVGFTVICHDGGFYAWPEMTGGNLDAADFGRYANAFVTAQ